MTAAGEVARLTRANARLKAKVKRLERERLDAQRVALDAIYCRSVKHPQQAEPGWEPPPHEAQTRWLRFKAWLTT